MSKYWSPITHTLTPYIPGEQPQVKRKWVKLNTNENPYPPSPAAVTAMRAVVNDDLRLYPDPEGNSLRDALAERYGVSRENVFVGNGSDEVLAHTFCALLQKDQPLFFPDISYSFYPVYCKLYGIDYRQVPLDEEFAICLDDYTQPNGGVIIPNPNAPTGRLLALDEIEILLKNNLDQVVVIDEAYIDFGGASAVSLIDQYPNLLVVQTVSKALSLAGLRVGYAFGQPHLIEALVRVKDSFNSYPLDRVALAGAVAAIQDSAYSDAVNERVIATREKLVAELNKLGFETVPSAANFVFTSKRGYSAKKLKEQLKEQGVLVRHWDQDRIRDHLRISVGTEAETETLLSVLKTII